MRNLTLCFVLLAGCYDYAGLSADYGRDGATTSDLRELPIDLGGGGDTISPVVDLAAVPGATCGADGGVVSTTGACLPASCSNGVSMEGVSPPSGTVGAPAGTFGVPANVFDGDTCSGWNAGSSDATLTLMFPAPMQFSRVQVANGATPATNEAYTFYGLVSGTWTQIGTHSYAVGAYGAQSPVSVTPGTYEGLQIKVVAGPSVVLILEVTLLL